MLDILSATNFLKWFILLKCSVLFSIWKKIKNSACLLDNWGASKTINFMTDSTKDLKIKYRILFRSRIIFFFTSSPTIYLCLINYSNNNNNNINKPKIETKKSLFYNQFNAQAYLCLLFIITLPVKIIFIFIIYLFCENFSLCVLNFLFIFFQLTNNNKKKESKKKNTTQE